MMSSVASSVTGAVKSVITGDHKQADLEHERVNIANGAHSAPGITTDFGVSVSDTDNWLKASRGDSIGPSLLEDHIAREKIHRFYHERIPERVVHARGAG